MSGRALSPIRPQVSSWSHLELLSARHRATRCNLLPHIFSGPRHRCRTLNSRYLKYEKDKTHLKTFSEMFPSSMERTLHNHSSYTRTPPDFSRRAKPMPGR